MSAGNSVLSAIYIEPPVNMDTSSQEFKILCITIETSEIDNITVRLIHDQNHTEELSRSNDCSWQDNKCIYSQEISWNGDTYSSTQGLTEYNGDHEWACGATYSSSGTSYNEQLQTYIKGAC